MSAHGKPSGEFANRQLQQGTSIDSAWYVGYAHPDAIASLKHKTDSIKPLSVSFLGRANPHIPFFASSGVVL